MQRIPYPTLTAAQQEKHARQRINLSRILFLLPEAIHNGMAAASKYVLFESQFDAVLRELIILRVGYLSKCAYEEYQHRGLAKQLGLTDAQIEAALSATPGAPLTERERTLLHFADEVILNVRPSDAALEGARRYLSDVEIFETLYIIGNYMFLARVLETSGIPLDDGVIVSNPDER